LRVGRLLQSLGRDRSLACLCEISGQVSQGSWPVGLTVDVLPNGDPGRIKVYFRSEAVTVDWLDRWYKAANCAGHASIARRFLDLFPWLSHHPYPRGAFIVSLEFHLTNESVSLKTDLAVTKWISSDERVFRGARALIQEIGGCANPLDEWLSAIGASSPDSESTSSFRFVGLGHEPDGSSHVNIYLEPCIHRQIHAKPSVTRKSPKQAIQTAIRFLLRSRSDEHWTDFDLPAGRSDTWVTAYTLAQLAKLPCELRPSDADQALDESIRWLMKSRSPNGAWGYNRTVPDDADSTSWAILALKRLHQPVPSSAKDFLLRCRDDTGAFATYPPDAAPRPAWAVGVPDVTASSLYALGESWNAAAELRFRRWRQSESMVPAYWWVSPFYTLALMLDWAPHLARSPLVSKLINKLECAEAPDSFDRSLLLSCLAALHRPTARVVASSLCQEQNAEGSWCSSALLRLPAQVGKMPWAAICSGPLFVDQNAIFTTATAISALSSVL